MPLAKPTANWSDYLDHLQMLASWLSPVENWLSGFGDGPQSKHAPEFIRYTDLIIADLGDAYNASNTNAIWFKTDNAAYRWGICYVIEGSQLGGEFLYKRLSTQLAPHELTYLQSKQAGRWPKFLQVMAKEVTTQGQINSACDGAMDAFDALLLQLRARDNIL